MMPRVWTLMTSDTAALLNRDLRGDVGLGKVNFFGGVLSLRYFWTSNMKIRKQVRTRYCIIIEMQTCSPFKP